MNSKWSAPLIVALLFAGGAYIRHVAGTQDDDAGPVSRTDQRGGSKPVKPIHFEDEAAKYGITFKNADPKFDPSVMARLRLLFFNPGVGISDIDGDGYPDVFIPSASPDVPSKLFMNQKGKGFVDRAREWGVADISSGKFAAVTPIFFDYDNDGRPDLFITGAGCSRLFHNTGHSFEEVFDSGLTDCKNSFSAIPLDYDNDGCLDLYVLRYWGDVNLWKPKTHNFWYENVVDARNGGKNALLHGDCHGHFTDVTDQVGGGDTHWSFDATLGDFTGEGMQEIYISNDSGPDTIYAIRSGKLVDITEQMKFPDRQIGMNTSLVDYDGTGRPAIYVSNSNERGAGYTMFYNFFFLYDTQRHNLRDIAHDIGLSDCGWAWSAAAYDFNLDGYQDLYITNGLITGKARIPRITDHGQSPALYRGPPSGTYSNYYTYVRSVITSLPGNVLENIDNWPPIQDRDIYGHQVNCLFLRDGDHFVRYSKEAGIRESWDGRSTAAIDFANTGAVSLVLGTQNKGVHFMRNTVVPEGHWVGFKLQGTKTNRDGVGTRLRIRQGERVQWRWSTGGRNGFLATSDPRLHFGLVDAAPVDVSVYWPSGRTQELKNVANGQYHVVVEP